MSNDRRVDDGGLGLDIDTTTKKQRPPLYKVMMLNDDYTPMEFVIYTLERFFGMSREQAAEVTVHIHRRGVGVCGTFTYDVAETKMTQVMDLARENQHPLQCTLEQS